MICLWFVDYYSVSKQRLLIIRESSSLVWRVQAGKVWSCEAVMTLSDNTPGGGQRTKLKQSRKPNSFSL